MFKKYFFKSSPKDFFSLLLERGREEGKKRESSTGSLLYKSELEIVCSPTRD